MFVMGWIRRVFSNWRRKLTLLIVLIMVMIILDQRHQLQRAAYSTQALKVERVIAGNDIADMAAKVKRLQEQKIPDQNDAAFGKMALQLEGSAVLLGAEPSLNSHLGDTCPEVYLGNHFYPYQYNNWGVEECDYGEGVDKLVTLVFRGENREQIERVTSSLWNDYPGVRVIVEGDLDLDMMGVHSVRKGVGGIWPHSS